MNSPPEEVVRRIILLTTFYHSKGKNARGKARKINVFRCFFQILLRE